MDDRLSKKTLTAVDFHGNKYDVPVEKFRWRPSTYAVVIRNRKVLLTHQAGSFNLPGGGIEFGEQPEAATIREVLEETGINIKNPQLAACKSNLFKALRSDDIEDYFQSILLFYACEFAGGELSIDGIDEHEKTWTKMPEWIPIHDLDNIKRGSSYEWRDVVLKAAKKINN